jgi:hypothetical protein
MSKKYQFTYKGKTYECIGENKDFDIEQFNTLIEWEDWITISNRIINQLKWGPNIKEIK